jgi:hypothetical protein
VEEWRAKQISTIAAKLIIYQAFVESELDAPKHLARQVHDLYFRPTHPEFEPRTLWSLTNAFTSAFKELEPIPPVQSYRQALRPPPSTGKRSRVLAPSVDYRQTRAARDIPLSSHQCRTRLGGMNGKRCATTGYLSGSLKDSTLLITNKSTRLAAGLVSSMLSCNLTLTIVR